VAFLHHLCAGIRYLFLDVDKGVDLATARDQRRRTRRSLVLTALAGWRLLMVKGTW
jgi:succinate dehydrogenase / fumarate reductase cytochrome b subunit